MYKQYLQIVNGLLKGENWTQLVVVVDEYRKCHGKMELPEYAKRIKLSSVIMHSSMKGSHQLLINIITSMLKSGAEMENGMLKIKSNVFFFIFLVTQYNKLLVYIHNKSFIDTDFAIDIQ